MRHVTFRGKSVDANLIVAGQDGASQFVGTGSLQSALGPMAWGADERKGDVDEIWPDPEVLLDGEIFAWGGSARSGFLYDLHILRLFHNDMRATSGEPAGVPLPTWYDNPVNPRDMVVEEELSRKTNSALCLVGSHSRSKAR